MCALSSVLHTWVLTLLMLFLQILTLYSLFFFFLFHSLFILSSSYCSSPRHFSPLSCPSSHFSFAVLLFLPLWLYSILLLSLSMIYPPLISPVLFNFSLLCHHHHHHPLLLLPSRFSCDRFPVSFSLQRGKAVSPSPLQWPIESCWAPISLLIGWAGLSRYWEEGLALLASCLSACMTFFVSAAGLTSNLLPHNHNNCNTWDYFNILVCSAYVKWCYKPSFLH